VIQKLGLDKPKLNREPVDVHARLEALPLSCPNQIEVGTIALAERCRVFRVALDVKENRAWLGWIKLENFQIPR
jgi:hypothetical protein